MTSVVVQWYDVGSFCVGSLDRILALSYFWVGLFWRLFLIMLCFHVFAFPPFCILFLFLHLFFFFLLLYNNSSLLYFVFVCITIIFCFLLLIYYYCISILLYFLLLYYISLFFSLIFIFELSFGFAL